MSRLYMPTASAEHFFGEPTTDNSGKKDLQSVLELPHLFKLQPKGRYRQIPYGRVGPAGRRETVQGLRAQALPQMQEGEA